MPLHDPKVPALVANWVVAHLSYKSCVSFIRHFSFDGIITLLPHEQDALLA